MVSREHLSELELFDREAFKTRAILCLECTNIEACHERVKAIIESKVSPIQDRSGRKVFRCIDVDGNVVEVFESAAKKTRKTDSNISGKSTQ